MPGLLSLGVGQMIFRKQIDGVQRLCKVSKAQSNARVAAEKDHGGHNDIFAALLKARDADGVSRLSMTDLVSESGLLIVGGRLTFLGV